MQFSIDIPDELVLRHAAKVTVTLTTPAEDRALLKGDNLPPVVMDVFLMCPTARIRPSAVKISTRNLRPVESFDFVLEPTEAGETPVAAVLAVKGDPIERIETTVMVLKNS